MSAASVYLLSSVCYKLRHLVGMHGDARNLVQRCVTVAVWIPHLAYYSVRWYGDVSMGFAAPHTFGECVKVRGWYFRCMAYVSSAFSLRARHSYMSRVGVPGLCWCMRGSGGPQTRESLRLSFHRLVWAFRIRAGSSLSSTTYDCIQCYLEGSGVQSIFGGRGGWYQRGRPC